LWKGYDLIVRLRKINKLLLFGVVISFLVSSIGCTPQPPKVSVLAQITNVSDKEFQNLTEIGAARGLAKNEMKKLLVQASIDNSNSVKDISILIPNLNSAIDDFYKGRSIGGGAFEENGKQKVGAEKNLIFDYRGLNENSIRDIFKSSDIELTWTNNVGQKVTNKYQIEDLIQITQ
jgi:hypothetical protein